MESVIIGLDHGYSAIKTAHCVFPTGLVAHDYPPFTSRNVLVYGGRYYIVGSGRQPIQKDKTKTEDYYLLTLAGIARELLFRKMDRRADIHLAAGLPLTSFGRDRDTFRKYLLRDGKTVSFFYEEREFRITITEVSLFPQGYAAALTRRELSEKQSINVIDIGGWTCDLMRVDNRIPDASTCRSMEFGVIRCVEEIVEQLRRKYRVSVPAVQIESVIQGKTGDMGEEIEEQIRQRTGEYVQNLLSFISESKIEISATPSLFMGGGASLIRQYASDLESICRPIILEDVCLNAKAYEYLAGKIQQV